MKGRRAVAALVTTVSLVAWAQSNTAQGPTAAVNRAAAASSPAPAPAPAPATGPSWSSLTANQRAALAPLERDWPRIDEQRKQKWLEIATRYPSLPLAERQRLHERMTDWARLTPAERARARLSFQEAKQLPAPERQARWEAYKALPVEQRRALAERGSAKLTDRPRAVAASAPAPAPASAVAASAAGPARVAPRSLAVKPVAPTIVQAKPGATTTPVNRIALPASHPSPPGPAKIAASPSQVDRRTLLPKVGPQSAVPAASAVRPTGQPARSTAPAPNPAVSTAVADPVGQASSASTAR